MPWRSPRVRKSTLFHTQFGQFLGHILAVGGRGHFLVDEQHFAIRSHVPRPPFGASHAIGLDDLLIGIAKDWIIQVQGFGKFLIGFQFIAAGGEIRDFEFSKGFAALTERLAFLRSATGKSLGEPGNHKPFFLFA